MINLKSAGLILTNKKILSGFIIFHFNYKFNGSLANTKGARGEEVLGSIKDRVGSELPELRVPVLNSRFYPLSE
jgi:hypothetical protein